MVLSDQKVGLGKLNFRISVDECDVAILQCREEGST